MSRVHTFDGPESQASSAQATEAWLPVVSKAQVLSLKLLLLAGLVWVGLGRFAVVTWTLVLSRTGWQQHAVA